MLTTLTFKQDKALKIEKSSQLALTYLAYAYLKLENFDKARELFIDTKKENYIGF